MGAGRKFEWPAVSIVLSTRRPGLVPQILQQISMQSYENLETILAIHGDSVVPKLVRTAINDFPGSIRKVFYNESVPFGEVLNHACSMASGQFITKMDDDDWYSPFHIEDLMLAQQYSGAQLVGAPVEFSYLGGLDITTRRSHRGECYTDHVAGGTILISKEDLHAVGGWRPVSSAVDRGLLDAVLASGGKVYRTHGQNYVMQRRIAGADGMPHTWAADPSVFLRDLKEQWDGLELPPQFRRENLRSEGGCRTNQFQSIFSRVRLD